MKELISLIKIHLKEFYREPGILFWAILFPILMAWGLGAAFSKKDELIRTIALVTKDDKKQSTPIKPDHPLTFDNNQRATLQLGNEKLGVTTYRIQQATWDEAILMLKRGKISLILEQNEDGLHYHFDPLNPEAQLSHLQISAYVGNEATISSAENISPLTQTGTRYVDFLVPGLMAMGIMMSCMWGISYGLIDKRMKKLMRRMVATPMKKANFLIAQFVARLSLNLLESGLLFLFAYLYFDLYIEGNPLALLIMIITGNLAFTGIAILISSRTSNTQIGNGLINVVVMPMMILSGIFFSYHNFPDWMVAIIQKLPLTILADTIRSIFLEGAGLTQVITPSIILLAISLVTFTTGLKIYKWY